MSHHVDTNQAGSNTQGQKGMAPGPVKTGLRWLDWRVIGMILAVKVMFYIYGTEAFQVLTNSPIGGFERWLEIWNHWDAVHYLNLAKNGYQASGEARFLIIFYPLFPWITRISSLFFGNYILSALVVVGIASVAAGLLLKELVRLDYPREIAERSVWFMFIFPGSATLHLPYTESLFMALVLGSFFAARRDRWAAAGTLGGLACLCRINGLVLIPALMAEAGHQFFLTRRWRWQWLWVCLIGLGVLGYLFLNYRVLGDPLMFMAYRKEHWFQTLSWPWTGIWGKIDITLHGAGEQGAILGVQDLLFIIIGFAGSVWACLKLRPAYAVWMVCNWLLLTSTSFCIGMSRLAVVMFPLYLLFSRLSAHRIWYTTITVWSLLFLALFTGLYVEGHWIF